MGRGPSIESRKNASDAKRGKVFTKIIRQISIAARVGGGDPSNNPSLRVAVDKGLASNMSKDVIERAIKKAIGELEDVYYEEVRYEGYALGGVAVIVDCLTDNRVRTVADVRHAFSRCGGNMGTEGSVAFMFKRLGVLSYAGAHADEESITEAAINAGAEDVVVYPEDGGIEVMTTPEAFSHVKARMVAFGLIPEHAEITFRADSDIVVDSDAASQLRKLMDILEDLDDVQDVYSNVNQVALNQGMK
ncbi:MAG TPA: YebC/PmpR family DNA-binding transcriptional regulator [Xylella sp.]